MNSDWQSARLGDLCEKIGSGATPRGGADVYVECGTALIRSQNVHDECFAWSGLAFITDDAAAKLDGVTVRAEDVLVNITGDSVARVSRAPADVLPARVNQHVAIVRPRKGGLLLAPFLHYALVAPRMKRHLLSLASSGATRNALTKSMLEELRIALPPLDEQRRIASVLGAFDNKIDSNDRRGDLEAELIDAMFDHHVVAHADGNDWADGDLTSIARFVNGRAFTKGATGTGRPVLRIKELNSGITDATIVNDMDADDDNIARHHDLLFSWSGSLERYRWHGPESLINQHIFKVLPHDGLPIWFVEGWVRRHLPEFQRIARDKATTMGHIKREHLKAAKVRIPPANLITDLHRVLGPLDDQLGALAAATITLGAIRDELLPKLVSGEIRVTDGDEGGLEAAA